MHIKLFSQGTQARPLKMMMNFQEVINQCQVVVLGFKGVEFKWNNKGEGVENIPERLDKALATLS